ncbi:5'-tyrosyl-DNA phosphodiesterase-like [Oculina patagonica]
MASFTVPRARGPLLVISVVVIVLLILRAFMNVRFGGSAAFGNTRSKEISMLTYNIWLDTEKMRERMEALGQIVEDLEPDLLTFQEVTLENLAVLQEQRWFSRYRLIPPDAVKRLQEGPSKHCVVILSSYPVDKWQVYPFKSSPRNRKLVVAETESTVSSKSVKFVIAATHLDYAIKDTKVREAELRESFHIFSGYDNVCAMGDLNIHDKVDGDIVLPSPWIDAWLSIPGNTDSNGYTWDRSKTPFTSVLRRTVNATSYQVRLDRVLCKLSDFKVKDMRIVGNKVTKSGILPSDHFGLFTVLELAEKSEHEGNKNKKPQIENEVYFNRPPGWEKVN